MSHQMINVYPHFSDNHTYVLGPLGFLEDGPTTKNTIENPHISWISHWESKWTSAKSTQSQVHPHDYDYQ